MKKYTHRGIALLALVTTAGIAGATDPVSQWNETLLTSVQATSMGPPAAARAMAMTNLAVFEAVNSVDRTYAPYRGYFATSSGTNKQAAAAQAAHDVLAHLFPSRHGVLSTQLTNALAAIPESPGKAAGVQLGRLSAASMMQHRANDGSQLSMPYAGGTLPGEWRPTPTGNLPSAFGQYAVTTPFGMTSPNQFRPVAPPSLSSDAYVAAVQEVQALGSATSLTRTSEQSDIARMWAFGSGSVTPPGAWNRIAQSVAGTAGLTIDDSARMFALLGIASADAAINSWDCKVEYNLWRPITAIRLADQDGRSETVADPTWAPLLTTPNFQAYTSGHSTFSSAAAAVLASVVGDSFNFDVTGAGITRSFTSFSTAAEEAGMSRIYGGIHFSFDNEMGLACGQQVGTYTTGNFLVVPGPGTASLLVSVALLAQRRRRVK
jgi:hypothetical protein